MSTVRRKKWRNSTLKNRTRNELSKRDKILMSARSVTRDFLNNTSLHGFTYLGDTIYVGSIGKLFWICILLLAFIGSGFMLKMFWDRVQDNPSIAAVESFFIPSFVAIFPAVTVCPMTGPKRDIREQILEKLILPPNFTKNEATHLLKSIFELVHVDSELSEKHEKLQELLTINGLHISDFLELLRGDCLDFVESCWWNEGRISCRQFFRLVYAYDGLCCSFNYDLQDMIDPPRMEGFKTDSMIPTAGYGLHSGFTLVLKQSAFNNAHDNGTIERIRANTVKLKLRTHHPFEYPNKADFILQSGYETQLGIIATQFRISPGVRPKDDLPCLEDNPDVELEYFPFYKTSNCFNSCRLEIAFSLCGCIPWQFSPFAKAKNRAICELHQFKCLWENHKRIWSIIYVNSTKESCICLSRCSKEFFSLKHAEIPIAASSSFAVSPIYRNVTNQNAVLRLFVAYDTLERYRQVEVTNVVYILSSIGGTFNLFLGCSILSIVEIVYFFLIFLISCYSIIKGN